MYLWLQRYAVEQTKATNRPFTVQDAAEQVQLDKNLPRPGHKGSMTPHKFMLNCCAENRLAAAAAAQAAAAQEEVVEGQEEAEAGEEQQQQ